MLIIKIHRCVAQEAGMPHQCAITGLAIEFVIIPNKCVLSALGCIILEIEFITLAIKFTVFKM